MVGLSSPALTTRCHYGHCSKESFQQASEGKLTVQNKAQVITSAEPSPGKIFKYYYFGVESTTVHFFSRKSLINCLILL